MFRGLERQAAFSTHVNYVSSPSSEPVRSNITVACEEAEEGNLSSSIWVCAWCRIGDRGHKAFALCCKFVGGVGGRSFLQPAMEVIIMCSSDPLLECRCLELRSEHSTACRGQSSEFVGLLIPGYSFVPRDPNQLRGTSKLLDSLDALCYFNDLTRWFCH